MIDIEEKTQLLNLCAGDMIADPILGIFGILMNVETDKQIAGYHYKSRFWKVYWVTTNKDDHYYHSNGPSFVEEYGLQMSIVIGIYDYYPIGNLNKEEKI